MELLPLHSSLLQVSLHWLGTDKPGRWTGSAGNSQCTWASQSVSWSISRNLHEHLQHIQVGGEETQTWSAGLCFSSSGAEAADSETKGLQAGITKLGADHCHSHIWKNVRIPICLCVCLFGLRAAVCSIHILAVIFNRTKGKLPTGWENNREMNESFPFWPATYFIPVLSYAHSVR